MKVRVLTCFGLLTMVLLLGSVSCKKNKIERKYLGDFLFTVVSHEYNMSTGSFDTTYTHEGRIVITDPPTHVSGVDPKDIYIQIDFAYNDIYRRTAVTTDGEFTTPGCDGAFVNNDELNCVFYTNGLSSSSRYTIHGVRR